MRCQVFAVCRYLSLRTRIDVGILIIRGGDPAIGGHSALPIGPEAETNRRSDWLTGDCRRLTVTGVSGQWGGD